MNRTAWLFAGLAALGLILAGALLFRPAPSSAPTVPGNAGGQFSAPGGGATSAPAVANGPGNAAGQGVPDTTAPTVTLTRPNAGTPRPAFNRDEESYIQKLRTIHNQVKSSALLLNSAGTLYIQGQIPYDDYHARLERASQLFGEARTTLTNLTPPGSMAQRHQTYMNALDLYNQGLSELSRLTPGGPKTPITDAIPFFIRGNDQIVSVVLDLWDDEYVPN